MKHIFLITLLFGTMSVESQTILNNQIKGVTVFLNGAQISRSLEIKLQPGEQEVRIKGMATHLDPSSIQVSSLGDAVLLGVRHELNYLEGIPPAAEELKKKKEGLLEELNKQQQQSFILQSEKNMLVKNQVQVVAVPNANTKLDDLKILMDFQRTRLNELLPKIAESTKKEKLIEEQIDKIEKQLNEWMAQPQQPSSDIVLSVQSKTLLTQAFQLTYYVYDARWEMRYDIHVKDIQSPIQFSYKATVFQNSGEDWKNVHLKLSTGNPMEGGTRPELQPWYLRNQPPVVYQTKRAVPAAQNAPEMVMADQASGVSDYTQVEEQITTRNYSIDIPYTILSNNKPFQVSVRKEIVPAKYIYYAVPKLDADAFLTAEIANWEDLELMNGEADLFLEGTYQGKTYIQTQNILEFLRLSLGRDKNIVINRTKIKDYSKNKFLSDKKEITKGYEIAVKNNKTAEVDIILEDQLPLSTQKEIEVEADELSGASHDEQTGTVRWVLHLSPKEDKKLKFKFKVTCPKDFVLFLD